jgi:hypothetical protein
MGPGSSASRSHAAASWSLLAATLWFAAAVAGIVDATPPKIDLDAFDAGKKTVLLPNSERLAYIDMGDRGGQPVVLIHGYTDNARDWVPLIPYLSRHDRLIVVDLPDTAAPQSRSAATAVTTSPMTSSCCWMRCTSARRTSSGTRWAASSRRPLPNRGLSVPGAWC